MKAILAISSTSTFPLMIKLLFHTNKFVVHLLRKREAHDRQYGLGGVDWVTMGYVVWGWVVLSC